MYDLFISMSASANKLKPTFPPCSHGKRLLRNHDAKKTQCEHSGVVLAYEQKSQRQEKLAVSALRATEYSYILSTLARSLKHGPCIHEILFAGTTRDNTRGKNSRL